MPLLQGLLRLPCNWSCWRNKCIEHKYNILLWQFYCQYSKSRYWIALLQQPVNYCTPSKDSSHRQCLCFTVSSPQGLLTVLALFPVISVVFMNLQWQQTLQTPLARNVPLWLLYVITGWNWFSTNSSMPHFPQLSSLLIGSAAMGRPHNRV